MQELKTSLPDDLPATLTSFDRPVRALVQGASGGLGLAFVRQLLEMTSTPGASGADSPTSNSVIKVVATCRRPSKAQDLRALEIEHPGRLEVLPLDVTNEESIVSVAGALQGRDEGLDLILNCSGWLHRGDLQPEKRLSHLDPSNLEESFRVNAYVGPLSREPAESLGVVLVESSWKAKQRPYHRQKLALILANQRHFALEQARRGVAVRYVFSSQSYGEALKAVAADVGTMRGMEPAERELRVDLEPLVDAGSLELIQHEGWLTNRTQFDACQSANGQFRMDVFYRRVRRDTGLLMEGGKPVGGKLSFDADNRKPYRGEPEAPEPPRFEVDAIKAEVGELIERELDDHPGELHLERLPATREEAARLWSWAKENCFEHFGPFEDAMTTRSTGLFHTRVSALLNLHRLLPRQVVEEALELDAPLSSREGFLRQILGWREFVRWIHVATDGFHRLAGDLRAGDLQADSENAEAATSSASPSFLGADRSLPAAYWGRPSGLACLDQVVADVWREGYSHHITRLMVLSNLATLLDISPRQLTDWFWVAYTDAYDWAVEPNVLGMGTFALGELMVTKPYVSGANYIHKMSDYCAGCAFDPKKDCPITSLYWQFLERHRERLEGNPRMNLALASAARRRAKQGEADREVFEWVTETLASGEALQPSDHPGSRG